MKLKKKKSTYSKKEKRIELILIVVPLPSILLFAIKYNRLLNQYKYLELQNEINAIPKNADEFINFAPSIVNNIDSTKVYETYVNNLNEVKESGILGQDLLNKYNCSNSEAFENYLEKLYNEAKVGTQKDIEAFQNALYDYDNDVYVQAYNQTVRDFENNYIIPENYHISFIEHFDFEAFLPNIVLMISTFALSFVGLKQLCANHKKMLNEEQNNNPSK